jgi:hypothetical protein
MVQSNLAFHCSPSRRNWSVTTILETLMSCLVWSLADGGCRKYSIWENSTAMRVVWKWRAVLKEMWSVPPQVDIRMHDGSLVERSDIYMDQSTSRIR